jgi:hypothetical protein
VAGKVNAPNASIFTSDPLEQIAAKGVMDRDMSGLANMFLYAFGNKREAGQDAYLAGLRGANEMALHEAKMEADQKMLEQLLKSGTELAKSGYETGEMPVMSTLFRDPRNQNPVADIWRRVQLAKANADNAQAANAGGDNVTVQTDVGPTGEGISRLTVKGRNGADAVAKEAALRKALIEGSKNNPKVDGATAQSWRNRGAYNQ